MLRLSITLGIFLSCWFNQILHSQTLSEEIDALIKKELPHAMIGILVKDAQTGQVLYSKNAEKLLSPASNIKLFTAAAALYHLKPHTRFLTTLAQKKQNFYITFNGSPSLTTDNLTHLLLNLKKNNYTKISGDIFLDTSRFKAPYYPSGVSYDDLGWYYTAPDTAVMLNKNAEIYEVSAKKLGELVTIKAKKPEARLKLINQVITVSKEQKKDHCSLHVETLPNNTVRLFGCMMQSKNPKEIQLAIPDPVLLAKQIIKKTLAQNNITFKGKIIEAPTPSDAQIIASYQSDDVAKLVTHMLKESDNLYANSLTKQLAFSLTKEGTHKQGAFAIKKILSEHTNLNSKQMDLTDGMGTRYNLISPKQIVILLTTLYNDKALRPIILSALPQAGVSGSLKDRMKKNPLEKIVFAKTGTMHDISSLSGYVINPKSHSLIFSIMINGINKPINIAKTLEEKILLAIIIKSMSEPEVLNDFG